MIVLSDEAKAQVISRADRILAELHAEIRQLRDTEMKLLALFFQVAAFVVAGVALLFSNDLNAITHVGVSVIYVLFITAFTYMIMLRLNYDKRTYAWLGDRVSVVRKEAGISELFGGSTMTFGSGSGYHRTQTTIVFSLICILALVIASDLWRISN